MTIHTGKVLSLQPKIAQNAAVLSHQDIVSISKSASKTVLPVNRFPLEAPALLYCTYVHYVCKLSSDQ